MFSMAFVKLFPRSDKCFGTLVQTRNNYYRLYVYVCIGKYRKENFLVEESVTKFCVDLRNILLELNLCGNRKGATKLVYIVCLV